MGKGLLLFDDPVIALVYWLVMKLGQGVAADWPLDLNYLSPVFADFGIASGDVLQ